MNLLDMITGPWAILPAQLIELQAIYATHVRGDKIDLDAIEARLGRPLANEPPGIERRENGVAVLTIEGVLAPKANMLTRISGGASTQVLARQVGELRRDTSVRAVVLAIDSPGGSVLGTPALAQAVRELAADKPTVAVGENCICSAAYWIGSAANAVYLQGVTDRAGSIGVVATHDYDPERGATQTEITAGRYKRIAGPNGPLSDEGKAYLQQQVDHIYSEFVDAIAANRGVPAGQVLERMADGRVFIGSQALQAGLVDGYSTVDAMADQLARDPTPFKRRRQASAAGGSGSVPRSLAAPAAPREAAPRPTRALLPPSVADMSRAEQAAAAQMLADHRRISFVEACKALGINH